MELTQTHSTLLKLIERGRAAQQAWVAGLSEAERNAAGALDHWSAKDDLAHITYWQEVANERLAAVRAGNEPTTGEGYQAANERIFEERRDWPWQRVLDASASAHATLAEHTHAFDEPTLTDPQRFAWTDGQPLAATILSDGFWHPLEHIARSYIVRGYPARADELLMREIIDAPELAAFPTDTGTALYNLACAYAIHGHPSNALALLPKALQLRPDLLEWSKQDSDLNSLRDEPAFQQLYKA